MKPLECQIGGDHYKKMKIQPIEYAMANDLGGPELSIVKYVSRWRDKGGVQDLEKAKHLLEIMIEYYAESSVRETEETHASEAEVVARAESDSPGTWITHGTTSYTFKASEGRYLRSQNFDW